MGSKFAKENARETPSPQSKVNTQLTTSTSVPTSTSRPPASLPPISNIFIADDPTPAPPSLTDYEADDESEILLLPPTPLQQRLRAMRTDQSWYFSHRLQQPGRRKPHKSNLSSGDERDGADDKPVGFMEWRRKQEIQRLAKRQRSILSAWDEDNEDTE